MIFAKITEMVVNAKIGVSCKKCFAYNQKMLLVDTVKQSTKTTDFLLKRGKCKMADKMLHPRLSLQIN